MSIDIEAARGASGNAEKQRQTEEGRSEQRDILEAMARWYIERGEKEKAADCRKRAEEMK